VVGAGTVVGEGAVVSGSVLWEGVQVGRGARVSGSIIATAARVQEQETVERAVLLPVRKGATARMALADTGGKP
jgi:ADP-glucose pyrophosphorylase